MLSSLIIQLFGYMTPSSTVIKNVFNDDFILFLLPLPSKYKIKVTFSYLDQDD